MFTSMVTIHDLIRRMALVTLAGYPDGIQAVKLRQLVEEEFRDYIDLNDKSNIARFKNSLWDLDRRYEEYVEKEVISPKFVLLKPTMTLLQELNAIVIPDLDTYFNRYEEVKIDFDEDKYGDNEKISPDVIQRLRESVDSVLNDESARYLLNVTEEEKKSLPIEVIELLAEVRHVYDGFVRIKRKLDNYRGEE